MAERTISMKLILAGEKEYRAAIADINREMRALDSQIKLVDSAYCPAGKMRVATVIATVGQIRRRMKGT